MILIECNNLLFLTFFLSNFHTKHDYLGTIANPFLLVSTCRSNARLFNYDTFFIKNLDPKAEVLFDINFFLILFRNVFHFNERTCLSI